MPEFFPPIEDCEPAPPTAPSDVFVWWREDRVNAALQKALATAIRTHSKVLGNDVKSVCWDVREEFEKRVRGYTD